LKDDSTVGQLEAYSGTVWRLVDEVLQLLRQRNAGDHKQKRDYHKK
jgi:hypothetical protein